MDFDHNKSANYMNTRAAWVVEARTTSGEWENIWDETNTFPSRELAQSALEDHIQAGREAFTRGAIAQPPATEDFRIVRAKGEA